MQTWVSSSDRTKLYTQSNDKYTVCGFRNPLSKSPPAHRTSPLRNYPKTQEEMKTPKLKFLLLRLPQLPLEKSLSITTGHCDLAIATHARKMDKLS